MKRQNRIFTMLLVVVLLLGSIPMNASAAGSVVYGLARVDATSLRLRSMASTTAKIIDTAYKNEVVVVVSKRGDWYRVVYNLREGYMHKSYLDVSATYDAELGYGKVNGTSVNVRSGAGTSYSRVTRVNTGDKAYIIGIEDGWYKVIIGSDIGYIRSDYLDLTEVPYENKDSKNEPLFFQNGKSTGTKPSADALNGTTNTQPEEPTPTEPTPTEPAPEPTEPPKEDEPDEPEQTPVNTKLMQGIAFVTGSGLRLRSEPNTTSSTIDSAAKKEVVVVMGKQDEWYKVNYNLQTGYMHEDYLDVRTTGHAELGYGRFNTSGVNVRASASTSTAAVTRANAGDRAYIIGIENGWYRVIFDGKIGFVRSDFLDLTEFPYENNDSYKSPKFYRGGVSTGTEPSADALGKNEGDSNIVTGSVTGAQIVSKAEQYLGVPYKWGGTSPSGFDCSGFVYYVFRSMGINISRTLVTMYAQGTKIDKDELQPGDIVLFQNTYKAGVSHVGIYVGNGKFIHSPSSGKVVSYADLYSDYYVSHYYGAVRYTK